jgi:class 3 adenylate cyclase
MDDTAVQSSVPDEYAQRAPWRAFHESAVEAAYRAWHRERIVSIARIVTGGAFALFLLLPATYLLTVGDPPRALLLGSYAVACPTGLLVTLSTFSRLRQWLNELFIAGNIVVGLATVWMASSIVTPSSGAVACGALTSIFYPLAVRVRTGLATGSATVLTAIPVAFVVNDLRFGDIDTPTAWLYIAALVTAPPLVVTIAALSEASMRNEFVTERTVARQKSQLQTSQLLLRRYVPEQVADAVVSNRSEAIERHERRKLTIFFSDLVGFTDLSDEMEPEDLATVLHDYFTEMSAIARRHGGTVDDLIGDAVLVLFGAPDFTDDRDQALRAVRMAVEMQAAMGALNQRWESAGIPEALSVRMGINTGLATVGNFGSAERTKYTALGKQVNVAARIQSQCEPGEVLISHPTWLLVREEITCMPKGELVLKGLRKPMPAYEVQA